MPTNMDYQQLAHMSVTNPMVRALSRFITPKLAEHSWLSSVEDNEDLICEIIRNLMDLCHAGNSHEFILETLADNKTHHEIAGWISTLFLSNNPGPKDRELLSFTDVVTKFCHDLCSDHFAHGCTADNGSEIVSDGGLSTYTQASLETETFPLFKLPAELRSMVYREALVIPDGGLVHSFAPPALLCANKQLRDEAIPVFYGQNRFEITIKRSLQDERFTARRALPSVDMWVWRRFLHMWDVFNCFGSNCLRHVRHITLIYQLSIDDGYSFGDGLYDRRLGFRLSSEPFEKDQDWNHGKAGTDSSDQDPQSDLAETEVEAADLEVEESDGGDSDEGSSGDSDDGEVVQVPEENSGPVGVLELNRGTVNWRSRRQTRVFLFHRMCEYGTDGMWEVYPMKRLAQMLWRCARDCPLSSANIDLICEDLPLWTDNIGSYTRSDPVDLSDPDDEDD